MVNNMNSAPVTAQTTEKESITNKRIEKGGPLVMILAALLVLIIGVGTFEFFQKGQVMNRTNELDTEIKSLREQVSLMKDNKVEVSKNASEALAKIKKDELRWSEVIESINKQLPTDASGARKINVISYSGSGEGKISLNMVTQAAALPPYSDVAQLIASFNNNLFFKDAYIPAISKGGNSDGSTTLSFVLNTSYQKAETGASDLGILNSSTDTGDAKVPVTKVPRSQ